MRGELFKPSSRKSFEIRTSVDTPEIKIKT